MPDVVRDMRPVAKFDRLEVRAYAPPGADVDCSTDALFDAWLPRMGPSSTLLWWYLARFVKEPDREITTESLAYLTGLSHDMVCKAVDRLVRFGVASWVSKDVLALDVMTRWQRGNKGPGARQ